MDVQPTKTANMLGRARSRAVNLFVKNRGWTKKISGALLDQAFFMGANFVLNVLYARWMGPENYGAFVVAYTIFLIPQNVYEALVVEPMTLYGSGKYSSRFRKYLGFVFAGQLGVTLVFSLFLLLAALIVRAIDTELLALAVVGAAIAAPMILTRYLTRQPFYVMSIPQWSALGGAIYMVVAVVFSWVLNEAGLLAPHMGMIAMGVGGIVSSTVLVVLRIKPDWSLRDEVLKPRQLVKDHWHYGRWSVPERLLAWIPVNLKYLVLPVFLSLSESGALRALNNLVQPVQVSMIAMAYILLPNFVRVFEAQGKAGLNRRLRFVERIFLLGTSLYLGVLVLFGHQIMSLLYDGQYDVFVDLPILFTTGMLPVLVAAQSVYIPALRAIGGVKMTFYARIVPTILALTVSIYLMAQFGLLGANLGNLLSATASVILIRRFYYRYEGEQQGVVEQETNTRVPEVEEL